MGPATSTSMAAGYGIGTGTAPNTEISVQDFEYLQNTVYDNAKVQKALQWDVTGDGVTIAVIDSGIDADHPDLVGNIDSANSGSVVGGTYDDTSTGYHGTMVAGVAAASNNGSGMQGVAPDADLLAIKVTGDGGLLLSDQIAGMDLARINGADIVNISFGLSGYENFSLQQAVNSGIMPTNLIDAYRRGIDADILYTLAAGNSGESQPEWDGKMAGYGVSDGQVLVVGALNTNGTDIASFSNRAGDAKNYFLMAPGQSLYTTRNNGSYVTTSGTSFAAPFVAGAAALVKSAGPPTLSSKDVAAILLTTAQDMGVPGNDAIYGVGRLDIEKALSPVGTSTLELTTASSGPTADLAETTASDDGLLADTLSGSRLLRNVLFFDSYDRSFVADLDPDASGGSKRTNEAVSWLTRQAHTNSVALGTATKLALGYTSDATSRNRGLEAMQLSFSTRSRNGTGAGIRIGRNWASSPDSDRIFKTESKNFLSLTDQGVGATVARKLGDRTSLRFTGGVGRNVNSTVGGSQRLGLAGLDHSMGGQGTLSLDLGLINERNQVLGTELGGAFSANKNINSQFLTLGYKRDLTNRLRMGMSYSFGKSGGFTNPYGLISNFSGGRMDAANFWLGYEGRKQSFQASLGRELGYRSGSLLLNGASSVTYDDNGARTVHFDTERLDLSQPTEYSATLNYARGLGKGSSLELMGKVRTTGDVDAGLKYKLRF